MLNALARSVLTHDVMWPIAHHGLAYLLSLQTKCDKTLAIFAWLALGSILAENNETRYFTALTIDMVLHRFFFRCVQSIAI